jgi:hypothetical protein
MEEYRLKVIEKAVLRTAFGLKKQDVIKERGIA